MYGVTDRQAEVLHAIASYGDRGAMCWQIRDRIYPADSKMRTYRTRGRDNISGSVGALGNLAVGRICSALADKGLVRHRNTSDRDFRYVLTAKGRERLGLGDADGTLDLGSTDA